MDTANPPKTKKRQTPDSLSRRALAGRSLAAIAALLLIGTCVLCARWGYADLVAADASSRQAAMQEHAAKTGELADAPQANTLRDELMLAQRFDPRNPTTAEQLGGLYALNVREGGAIRNQRAKALEQYSQAVVMRPTSPYSWASLAWTKYYLGQVDAEFYRALDAAIQLGPWEPEVQYLVVDLGLALWDELPPGMRPKIMTIAQNGTRRYAPQIIAIARKQARLAEVCKIEKLRVMPACKTVSG